MVLPLIIPIARQIASTMSMVACGGLLVHLHRDPANGGLLQKQMWHLAIGNVCYLVVRSVIEFLTLCKLLGMRISGPDCVCTMMHFLWSFGSNTAMLVEAHLAVAFLAAICRWSRVLALLSRMFPLLWLAGTALAALDAILAHETLGGPTTCTPEDPSIVVAVESALTLSTGSLCYIVACLLMRGSGFVRKRRVWSCVALFPVIFVLTNGPIVIGRTLRCNTNIFWITAGSVFNLNGLLNVAVYTRQSRRFWHQEVDVKRGVTFGVDFFSEQDDVHLVTAVTPSSVSSSSCSSSTEAVTDGYLDPDQAWVSVTSRRPTIQ